MKSMSNDNSWLGFTLSPSMNKMDGAADQSQALPCSNAISSSMQTSFPQPSHQLVYPSPYFEVQNADYFPTLAVMPLRSDGSLCMMETMNTSQLQGMVASTPKLENFFGGTTMGGHNHYEGCDNGHAGLTLDSMYYHQDINQECNSQDFFTNSRHQQQQQLVQLQQYPVFSSLKSQELYQRSHETKETHPSKNSVQNTQRSDNNTNGMKNWVPVSYYRDNGLEQRMMGSIDENVVESGSLGAVAYGDLQPLSLSMSPGSQSSRISGTHLSSTMAECISIETKKRGPEKVENKQTVHRKSIDTFGQRTSQYRGVTRHRWTGRYEAHLWDNSCKKEGQSRKGRQVYLGGYDMEDKAARAYDLAALKYWGPSTHINFPLENYQNELEEMKNMNRQEYVAHLRRRSSGFSRGASIYRGVTRHHQHGRWQARIGRVAGNKDLYLGTFGTQEEAAEAYDIAAIKFRGVNAVTNFDISRYDVDRIMASNTLIAGELARRIKNTQPNDPVPIDNPTNPDFPQDSNVAFPQFSHKPATLDFKNSPFGVPKDDLIETEMCNAADQDSVKTAARLQDASSMVTSLSCSREGSMDKPPDLPMQLASMPPSASKMLSDSSHAVVNSWILSNQLKSHAPVFAAWTDAS